MKSSNNQSKIVRASRKNFNSLASRICHRYGEAHHIEFFREGLLKHCVVINCMDGGNTLNAFLTNPGRLQELLLPGAVIHLQEARGMNRRLSYTAVAVEREGRPVVLHTHRANEVVRRLIGENAIPGMEGAEVLRSEIKKGESRFDFLLRRKRKEILLEVKSCTLW